MTQLFILTCLDREECFDLRMATRTAHLEYVKSAQNDDFSVLIAGPLLDDDDKPIGSHFIIEAVEEAAVRDFAKNDPYTLAGLFADTKIGKYKIVTGALAPT